VEGAEHRRGFLHEHFVPKEFISSLGHSPLGHLDGNYVRLVLPLSKITR
jgi:hypothetical protein